jgi:hypothetical protein
MHYFNVHNFADIAVFATEREESKEGISLRKCIYFEFS